MRYAITVDVPDELVKMLGGLTSAGETQRQDARSEAPSDDPWASRQTDGARSTAASAEPRRGTVAASGPRTRVVSTPKGEQTWQFDRTDAPDCLCGEPAGHVQGAKADGKPWRSWRCAKGADDQGWRDKCDFNQWA